MDELEDLHMDWTNNGFTPIEAEGWDPVNPLPPPTHSPSNSLLTVPRRDFHCDTFC